MNKAYKFRLYPNELQKELFAKTFGCVRFIYNKMLSDKIDYYNKTKKSLNCYPSQYKNEFIWLKEVDSLALANAQLNLQSAYTNFFKIKKVGFPKYKSKKYNSNSYTTNCVNNNIRLENGFLVLPKLKKVKIKQHKEIPKDYTLKSVTVSQTKSGKYYASLLFEYEETITEKPLNKVLGLDFSMHELFVSNNNVKADYPRFYRKAEQRLALEQRKLSKMEKGSKNRNKQRKVVARVHEKIANQRKDFLHKLSNQIANDYDLVCIETLDMKDMSKDFGKSVFDNSWGTFTSFLDYKLKERGKKLIKVDKYFPSSKICSGCGNVKTVLPLSVRTYKCEVCGLVIDRDLNAGINIKNEGLRLAFS